MSVRLEVSFRLPRLGARYSMPQAGVEVTHPRLEGRTTQAAVRLDIRDPKLVLDLGACWDSIGILSPSGFAAKNAARGLAEIQEYAALKSYEGDLLASVEQGVEVWDGVDLWEPQIPETNIAVIPDVMPGVELQPGAVKVEVEKGEYAARPVGGSFKASPSGGEVEVYLKDPGYIKVEPKGTRVDVLA